MILTEKEAKEKACCDGGYGAVVRADDEGKYDCIASACMAWRWALDPDGHPVMKQVKPPTECPDCKGTGTNPDPIIPEPHGCSNCDGSGKIGHFAKIGFCGLAGKPGASA